MSDIKVTITFKREEMDDDSPDLSWLTQDYAGCDDAADMRAADAVRLEAYNRGDWHMIGIRAVATIWVARPGYQTNYELTSPGVWGIESDSGEEYLKEVFGEECSILRADIEAIKEFKS